MRERLCKLAEHVIERHRDGAPIPYSARNLVQSIDALDLEERALLVQDHPHVVQAHQIALAAIEDEDTPRARWEATDQQRLRVEAWG